MNCRLFASLAVTAFITSCAANNEKGSFCDTSLSMEKIASDLGFQMRDRAMHDYHFYNDNHSFELLATCEEVGMYVGSSLTPVWSIKGPTTEEIVESKIRKYLYDK